MLTCIMTIRALSHTSDRSIVASFFSRAADYVTLETGEPPNSGTIDEFFDERPPNVGVEDALHFGLFEADYMLGLIAFSLGLPEPTDSYIGLLLLAHTARGNGIGPRALAHATSLARARGATRQLIAVLDTNPKGRAFWEREGFLLEKTFAPTADCHTRHRLIRAI